MRLLVVFLLSSSLVVSIANLSAPTGAGGARVMAVTSGSLSTIGPSHAPPGYGITGPSMGVTITGSGFISPSTCGLFATGGSGALFNTNPNFTSCVVSSQGALLATFAVNTTARPGGYTVNIIDDLSGHHFNSPLTIGFTVDAIPTISFSVNSGSPGAFLTVTGSGFAGGISSNPDQGACSISAHLNGAPAPIISSTSCFIDSTGHLYSTQFTIANAASPGGYLITVNGTHGDFGQKGFTVTTFSVSLNPTSGHPGQVVFVSGNSAPPNTGCSLQSNNPNLIASVSGLAGTINGVISGSFTVGSNAAGRAGGGADNVTLICGSSTAFATFTVTPIIFLNPTSGAGNRTIAVSGLGFRADLTGCQVSDTPIWNGISYFQNDPAHTFTQLPSCTVTGTGAISGSFQVNPTFPDGIYNITVTGFVNGINVTNTPPFSPNAFALFQKGSTSPLNINPTTGSPPLGALPGTSVTITGNGFSQLDTSCIITQEPNGTNDPYFISGLTCSVSGGSLTAKFVVAPGATNETYVLKVKGQPANDVNSVLFTVVPRIALSPNSGTGGTQVTVTGSGFKGGFGVANCSSAPSSGFPSGTFITSPSGLIHLPFPKTLDQCNRFNDGTISGSFNVSLAASQGAYLVTVNATGHDAGSAPFAVGARLLTITPSAAGGLTFVDVTGTGFVQGDTSCVLTTTPTPSIFVAATNICSITNGNVQASFEVSGTATAGTYNVIVTGSPNNDIGVGVFSVAFVTTTTATSTSYTSSSTTLTTLSTTTTTTQVSTSLTTTTYQTTGVSTETSRTFTTTTILAPTTATFTTIFTVTTLFGTAVTTVVGTITKTLGQVIRSAETSYSDGLALLAVLILLSTWVLRRLLD